MAHQVLKNFAQKAQLAVWLRQGEWDVKKTTALVAAIYDKYLRPFKAWEDIIRMYLVLCLTIDNVKLQTLGRAASTMRSNYLMSLLAAKMIAEKFPGDAEMAIIDKLQGEYGSPSFMDGWMAPKLQILGNLGQAHRDIAHFAQGLTTPQVLTADVIDAAREQASCETAQLMSGLRELRKYGVKPCFFQDGMLHAPQDAWVFMDPTVLNRDIDMGKSLEDPMALVSLASRAQLARIGADEKRFDYGEMGRSEGLKLSFDPHILAVQDAKGEFFSPGSMGIISCREIFARVGKEEQYEFLRYTQALRLFDLVVPVSMVPNHQPEARGILAKMRKIVAGKKDPIQDLMLPRLKTLDDMSRVLDELEREVDADQAETLARVSTERRRHDVVWHIRKLPAGKQASPEARQAAAEHGISLSPNETYVRAHKRGSGEEILSHRAVRSDRS